MCRCVLPEALLAGHSTINHCMRTMGGQIVSLVALGQFIVAGATGAVLLSPPEYRGPAFCSASVLIIVGAVRALRAMSSRDDRLAVEGIEVTK
jgi:membrane protein implicated in regulation of membrane protease activity